MKRNIKKAAIVMSVALAFSGLYGCGNEAENVTAEKTVEETDEGQGDIIEEEIDNSINELALKGPSYTGLTELDKTDNEDGTYRYQDMMEDGLTVITNMSYRNSQSDGQDPDAYAENFVCAVVDDTDSAKIISSKDDEAVSSMTSYPSYRVYWETGSNEDSRQNAGVVVLTDNFTYYYGYSCPVDFYEENANLYENDLDGIELTDKATLDAERANMAGSGDTSGAEDNDGGYGVYADKMNELKSAGLADQFTLAYINDNGSDTPELIASDSKGSFEHENAFIFTVYNGEVVEVASAISGVDGANLDYAIGANLIHISGSAAGMRDVFSRIENGKLEEVFVAEASSMDENAKYTINGESVKEDEYYKQINAFMEPYNPLVRIAYDGLYEVTYTYKDGFGGFEQGSSEKYSR
ncbi:MAG: hypothetical protein K5870_10590 [Lachnospiraceae bacterium]|nr:hypothetical protein [Lachnospiraceae bacterium]